MDFLRNGCAKLTQRHRGQSITEYALILGAIAIVCVVGYRSVGQAVSNMLTNVNNMF